MVYLDSVYSSILEAFFTLGADSSSTGNLGIALESELTSTDILLGFDSDTTSIEIAFPEITSLFFCCDIILNQ